jgi:hypothetical protein
MEKHNPPIPHLTSPLVRGCSRFSGFTTTAYPLRVKGDELFRFAYHG